MEELLRRDWFLWGVGLVLGFQVGVVVLGEIAYRLQRRGRPASAVFRILRNTVLPVLVALFFLTRVAGAEAASPLVRIVETLFWVTVLYAGLSAVNVLVFEEAAADTWRARVPQLFLDLARFLIVLVGAAIVLSVVWKRDLGGLLAALGVGSIVLGLALQDTLGNVMAGIALLFERPFQTGDWIKIGDCEGEVIEMNWRSVRIRTRERDLLVVPNSILGKQTIVNVCEPTRLHAELVVIGFSPEDPPNRVKEVLRETALSVEGVLADPGPRVEIAAYEGDRVLYETKLSLVDLFATRRIRDEFTTRVWYAARRAGLTLAVPTRALREEPPREPAQDAARAAEDLARVAAFASLDPHALARVGRAARRLRYAGGEALLRRGEIPPAVCALAAGGARLSVAGPDGSEREVLELGPGDLFGEEAFVGPQQSPVSVVARGDVEVLALPALEARALLDASRPVARAVAELIESRGKAVERLRAASPGET
jgi:small-conductance mechanosensitive channel